MKAFYDRVFTTPNRADALREAVLAIREQYPHPIYLGAFRIDGQDLGELGRGGPPVFSAPYIRPAPSRLFIAAPILVAADGERDGRH